MIRNLLLGLSFAFILNCYSLAQWIHLDKYAVPDAKPEVQLISDDAVSTVIKVNLPGFYLNEFEAF